ncbi:MAG: 5-deoxy-glucuronate isomerase [Saccharothrix sp.]|nr:5-deoxy-glucuronate isomerase [Saccharothrix sp.]
MTELELQVLTGPRAVATGAREHVLVVLGGTCDVVFAGGPRFRGLGARADVFDGPATAVYAPVDTEFEVTGTGFVAALVSAPGRVHRAPYVVTPADVVVQRRGEGAWAREVHDVVGENLPADRLLVGETFSGDGVWSSYPPHRHDRHDPPHEVEHREVFLVRVSPASGFAVFLRYPDDDAPERAEVVHDGDVVAVDDGFHSFAVAAGHRLYYLWALAGPDRHLGFRTDRRHAWLLESASDG